MTELQSLTQHAPGGDFKPPELFGRRRFKRLKPQEKISLKIVWSGDDLGRQSEVIYGNGIDFSENGIQFSFTFPIPIGFEITLQVAFLERNFECLLRGIIVWTGQVKNEQDYRMGVELSDVPVDKQAQWKEFFPH